MPDTSTAKRLPNLGKLSIALLEHTVKPILGEKAIDEIKSPVIEKDLINSLINVLERTEKRFIQEFPDKAISEMVLNLPLSNLPSVIQAVRSFYSTPTDTALEQILFEQIKVYFPNTSIERINSGVSTYIRFLKNELTNLNSDFREKISTQSTLKIQDNTARMANALERFLENSSPKEVGGYNKQFTKIISCGRVFDLPNVPSDEQGFEILKGITRQVFQILGYAFLDTCEVSSSHDFNFLLSLAVVAEKNQMKTLQIGLTCHISPFVSAFEEILSTLFDKSDEEFVARTNKYPSDLNIKMGYKWAENLPYRVTRVGNKSILFECLDSNSFMVKFPMKTSDLLVIISAMINGKPLVFDDVKFSPDEVEFMNYIETAKEQGLSLSDFEISASNPETWSVTTAGVQKRKRNF